MPVNLFEFSLQVNMEDGRTAALKAESLNSAIDTLKIEVDVRYL